jgi:hypothetical protein
MSNLEQVANSGVAEWDGGLRQSGRTAAGLTLVTQTSHKEKMMN